MRTLYTELNNRDYETLRRLRARTQKQAGRRVFMPELIGWLIKYANTLQIDEETDRAYNSFEEFIEQKVI